MLLLEVLDRGLPIVRLHLDGCENTPLSGCNTENKYTSHLATFPTHAAYLQRDQVIQCNILISSFLKQQKGHFLHWSHSET